MKKAILLSLLLVGVMIFSGCVKNNVPEDYGQPTVQSSLILDQEKVKENVDGWVVFTNPQFRYELRYPKNWTYSLDDEGAKISVLYPKNKQLSEEYFGAMIVQGIVNWKNSYSIPEYYAMEALNNYYELGFEARSFILNDYKAVWFPNVDGLYGELPVQVVAIDLNDRLLEIHLFTTDEETLTVLNSLKFY